MKNYLIYKNKTTFIGCIIFQTLETLVSVCVALLLNWMIDEISLTLESPDSDLGTASLLKDFIVCAGYAVVHGILLFISGKLKAKCVKKACLNLRTDVMSGLFCETPFNFNKKNSSEYISLMNQNMSLVEENYFKNKLCIYESIVSIVFAVILLVVMNPVIAAVSLVLMSIPSLLPRLFSKKLASLQSEVAVRGGKYNGILNDIFRGFCAIKDYGIENKMKPRHEEQAIALESSKEKFSSKMATVYAVSGMAGITVQFLVIAFAGILAVRGYLTIGSIIAVTQLTGQVISPAFQLSAKVAQLKSVKDILTEMNGIIENAKSSDCQPDKVKPALTFDKNIELCNVDYFFNENKKGLDSVSLRLDKGKHYVVTGKSGCGKSTLLKVISGYYTPSEGDILVDGDCCKHIPCATVSQNVVLFSGTIKDNITLFNEFSDEEVMVAVEKAGLKDFVDALPNGLETQVEENGSSFSGGERQRISIARALIYDRQLLLFDEATSALDSQTAMNIEQTIRNLSGKTVIAVTHRTDPVTLGLYDKEIKMAAGKAEVMSA